MADFPGDVSRICQHRADALIEICPELVKDNVVQEKKGGNKDSRATCNAPAVCRTLKKESDSHQKACPGTQLVISHLLAVSFKPQLHALDHCSSHRETAGCSLHCYSLRHTGTGSAPAQSGRVLTVPAVPGETLHPTLIHADFKSAMATVRPWLLLPRNTEQIPCCHPAPPG